jgi:hypothetical protein
MVYKLTKSVHKWHLVYLRILSSCIIKKIVKIFKVDGHTKGARRWHSLSLSSVSVEIDGSMVPLVGVVYLPQATSNRVP